MVALTTTALLLALVLLHPCAGDQDLTLNLLPPNSVPPTLRSYNLLDNFCLLQQHASTRVGNLLLLDGGLAKYKITKDGISYGVADLNGFTVALDLAADFSTNTPPLKQLTKKPAAVVSEHGMWTDGASVWIQGGVFDADYANSSAWYVETAMIPPYEIWVLHAGSERWEKETVRVQDGSVVERTAAGAGACSEDTCYWLGGYASSRTEPSTSPFSAARRGMLAFELGTGVLRNESIEGYGMGDEGFVSGSLHFLPTEEGSGILVSLMAEKGAVDRPSGSDEWSGQRNSFEYVMIYDIEHRTWYNQSTKPWDDCTWTGHCAGNFCKTNDDCDGKLACNSRCGVSDFPGATFAPPPRTGFCTALVYDDTSREWDLWMFGGQLTFDPSKGDANIYVLSMPAFLWVKIDAKQLGRNWIRGHTCHAVGNQLLLLGGGFPGKKVDPLTTCSPRLINILDMNNPAGFLENYSSKPDKYRQPPILRKGPSFPRAPWANWTDPRVQKLYDSSIGPRNRSAGIGGEGMETL